MEFRILGRLEVVDGGRPLELREGRQRALLAILLVNANKVVSSARLIEWLWEEGPPPSAPKMLHKLVSQLRSELGRAHRRAQREVVATAGTGYLIRVGPDDLDALRFQALVQEARIASKAGDASIAVLTLRRALGLWRGRALEEFPEAAFAREYIARLEEERMMAVQERIDGELALGQHAGVVSELENLVAEEPYRESLRAQLMLALYRSGRQAEALAVYRRTYDLLDEELGIRPSQELQRLQQAILTQDPGLDPPATPRPDEPAIARPIDVVGPSASSRGWFPKAAIGGAVLVASIVALQFWAGGGDRPSGGLPLDSGVPSPSAPASSLDPTGSATNVPAATSRPTDPQVLAELSVALPAGFGFGFGSVWVAGHHDRTLRRIDPETNQVVDVIEGLGFQSNAVLASAGSVWVSSADGLYRVDPVTRQFTTIPGSGGGLASGFLNVWETTLDDRLIRIDLETNEVLEALSLGSGSVDWANELAIGFGSVWVAISDENKLVRVDPRTNTIITTIEGFGDTYSGMPIAIGEGGVWILKGTGAGGTLFRVDPVTDTIVARIPVGTPGGRVAVGGGWVWCGNAPGTLTKVDPDSDRVVATYRLRGNPQDVDFGFGSVWVDAYDASLVWRIAAN